jgi:hypothetical protein
LLIANSSRASPEPFWFRLGRVREDLERRFSAACTSFGLPSRPSGRYPESTLRSQGGRCPAPLGPAAERGVCAMGDKRLILTVGLPRSGKTTLALAQGHPVVCPDALRAVMGDLDRSAELAPMVEAVSRYMVRALFEVGDAMLGWDNSGFGVHATSRIRRGRRKRLEQMLMYMSRHAFNPKGIEYDAEAGQVHYRPGRKHPVTRVEVMTFDAVEFIALLAQHIPHARKHQVRFYGAANPKVRERLGLSRAGGVAVARPDCSSSRGRKNWAQLIERIHGVNPLLCNCGGTRRLIAVILGDESLRRILNHQGLDSRLPRNKPARDPPTQNEVQLARELGFEPDRTDFDDVWWDVDEEASEQDEAQTNATQSPPPSSQSQQEILLGLINRLDGKVFFGNALNTKEKD